MKTLIKKITPNFLLNTYHFLLALLGALVYGFPSKKIKVIGVTGTKGKSTTVYLAGRILEEAGSKVGWISSLSIKIGKEEKINPYHLTMPGKMFIQRSLEKMVSSGCQYALIEVTSEGIKQHRHQFIDFKTALFTNLAPEHLEAHGGFEKYREAKEKLFKALNNKGQIIVNLDDANAGYFLKYKAKNKIGFSLTGDYQPKEVGQFLLANNWQTEEKGISFNLGDKNFNLSLLGELNIYNSLAAISIALSENIDLDVCRRALEKIKIIPGRLEEIKNEKGFRVFVDLAHTPDSFKQVFEMAKKLPHGRIISVFGCAGGGRDKWKRPKLGQIAAEYSNYIILTNEDPYWEDPQEIINQIKEGIKEVQCEEVLDRKEAILKALKKAKKNDIVLVLGKGTEATLVIGDKSISWDDRQAVREGLSKLSD